MSIFFTLNLFELYFVEWAATFWWWLRWWMFNVRWMLNRWMFRVHFYHFHFSLFHFHFHWVNGWMRWMALRCDDAGRCREVEMMTYWSWPKLAMVAMDSSFGVSNWCLPNMFSKWWLFSSICGRVDELTRLRNWWTVMDGVFFGESDVDLKTT